MSRTGVNPPFCDLDRFLVVCQFVDISNQMEQIGEVWNFGYYNESHFYCNSQSFRLRHLAPFDWKFLQIGTQRAKDMRKNVFILQEGGPTPALPTLPVIRVVLLHKQGDRVILYFLKCIMVPTT